MGGRCEEWDRESNQHYTEHTNQTSALEDATNLCQPDTVFGNPIAVQHAQRGIAMMAEM